jgi:sulfur carrier protein
MLLKINGKTEKLSQINNLMDLIIHKGLNQERIVIEHNSQIIPREKFFEIGLKDQDNIEIVSFVGGG